MNVFYNKGRGESPGHFLLTDLRIYVNVKLIEASKFIFFI